MAQYWTSRFTLLLALNASRYIDRKKDIERGLQPVTSGQPAFFIYIRNMRKEYQLL
jgi:hypothetical protein